MNYRNVKLGLIWGTWSAYEWDQCTVFIVITREHHLIYMRYPYISVIEHFSPSNDISISIYSCGIQLYGNYICPF